LPKKRRHQGRKDIAPHQPRNQECHKKVQAKKGRKGRKDAGPNTTGDFLGRIGQTAYPVFDVFKRAQPATARIDEIEHDLPDRPSVPTLEYQLNSSVRAASPGFL